MPETYCNETWTGLCQILSAQCNGSSLLDILFEIQLSWWQPLVPYGGYPMCPSFSLGLVCTWTMQSPFSLSRRFLLGAPVKPDPASGYLLFPYFFTRTRAGGFAPASEPWRSDITASLMSCCYHLDFCPGCASPGRKSDRSKLSSGWRPLFYWKSSCRPCFLFLYFPICLFPDRPEKAELWLTGKLKEWGICIWYLYLEKQQEKPRARSYSYVRQFTDKKYSYVIYFWTGFGLGLIFWMPQGIERTSGWSRPWSAVVIAIPMTIASFSRFSDPFASSHGNNMARWDRCMFRLLSDWQQRRRCFTKSFISPEAWLRLLTCIGVYGSWGLVDHWAGPETLVFCLGRASVMINSF